MKPLFAVLLAALVTACATGAATRPDRSGQQNQNLIDESEIRGVSAGTALDVVHSLRPAWLLQRRPTSLMRQEGPLVVYLDGRRYGDASSLRQISASSVRTIRYYQPSEAQARFGPDHPQGAIEVTTVR
ncbi:MAG TPA: hypothetical protein VGQ25_03780 [Gemmatimonadales bacterium]|jgi:hypothetical protein|nr:hypothetical protein [Gemmatimonadales bacterium]